ncbi:MAG: hypothetical protein M1829_005286 [Trizodia sp. TS-e1964]|nr:MAG: hypothetical protein M1829_005286 [Trizodia sp. TS-e1964]
MFSHVPQHPYAHPHHFENEQYPTLHHSLPNSPHFRSFPPDVLTPARPSPQIPQRYAYPVQRNNSYPSQLPSHGGSVQGQYNITEHMLRRKTPNGTLAAGYDGTPVGIGFRSPAVKHVLLPVSDGRINQSPSAPFNNHSQIGPGFDARNIPWSHPTPHIIPGVDSMLNQVAMQQAPSYIMPHGKQVPTVLQPMYQPCAGPTASNDEGPYGSYWPNGAFIPYRPAAFRAPVYQYTVGGNALVDSAYIDPKSTDWPRYTGSIPLDDWRFNRSLLHPKPATVAPLISPPVHHTLNGYDISPETDLGGAFQPFDLPQAFPYTQQFDTPHQSHSPVDLLQEPPNLPQFRQQTLPPIDHFQPRRANFDSTQVYLKEKVLAWAHTVYVDLLTSIHQSRRASQQGINSQNPPKAGIYPKPPRQQNSCFAQTDQERFSPKTKEDPSFADSSRSKVTETPSAGFPPYSYEQVSKRVKRYHAEEESSKDGRENERSGRGFYQGVSPGHFQLQNAPNVVGFNSSQVPLKVQTLRRTSGASVSSIYLPPSQGNPTADAMSALELLSKICSEVAWQWIDGMLVGGCLAYGLGHYDTALKMYSNIIELDSNHVEAISNKAATLLSLNRRAEAEQHWLRSVKLRPSYFEAVEHLVGLLCGDHRGKEAVNIIEFVERSLKYVQQEDSLRDENLNSETSSEASQESAAVAPEHSDRPTFDYDNEDYDPCIKQDAYTASQPGFGSSGYAIPGSENGRMLALIHAKGNMLYALGNNTGAARAFEDAVLIGAGKRNRGIQSLIKRILAVVSSDMTSQNSLPSQASTSPLDPVLLTPERALQSSKLVFPNHGELPGLKDVPNGLAKKAAISTTSNSLLSLAKIFQDGMSSSVGGPRASSGVRDILALYYLSLSLQPSPSTANNVGILLASVQQSAITQTELASNITTLLNIPGVVPGSGISLALAYYNYGLNLDSKHAHLYTNLGSLLKDIGQLSAAIKMYEQAVACDHNFDIALANLANAVKDQGRISDAITYYKRAVDASPDFAEAVCGLSNALNSVCSWIGRGGVVSANSGPDRWHVDDNGRLLDSRSGGAISSGWMKRVVDIVEKQLDEGRTWGAGVLQVNVRNILASQIDNCDTSQENSAVTRHGLDNMLVSWAGKDWEGAKVVRLVERSIKIIQRKWYHDKHIKGIFKHSAEYARPQIPSALAPPAAPTVLPFHTFTCPLSAKQIRMISQRNALRISCSTLRAPWLPSTVYHPPGPPRPHLNVGYVSSDFNNHPLAHLMQSVFGFHNPQRVKAFCYATTLSDRSIHREKIEREAPVFYDANSWSADRLVKQIVRDEIHILVNLNGYTRGARNEVFAARPVPIQMSFMGFAGTLGSEWCDYLLADDTAIPPETLRPWRRNIDLEDQAHDGNTGDEGGNDWSAPDAGGKQLSWAEELERRWNMRQKLFPKLPDDAIILGNFNQLYKIEPTTFRSWLRILSKVPKAVLWLLRFPELGESNLRKTAEQWAGKEIASRIIFTEVAPKPEHISRARVCDLILDTPECNAHTTAADVLWSGTPLLTLPRYKYKMCSRMAASILKGALPKTPEGRKAAQELIAQNEEEYEERASQLALSLCYRLGSTNEERGRGRLMELRKILYESRWTSALFDTKRWVRDLEGAYEAAWRKWVLGEGGDIKL